MQARRHMLTRMFVVFALAGCGRRSFDATSDGTTADVAGLVPCAAMPGLVGCWQFEDNTGDGSGWNNHATGGVTFVPGRVGRAAQFDANVNLRVADSQSLDFEAALTIAAWIRLDAYATVGRSVVFDRNNGFAFYVRNDGVLIQGMALTNGGNQAISVTTIPLATWTHVAGTYRTGQIAVWIDGALEDTTIATGIITTADTLGSRIGGNLPDATSMAEDTLSGAIDELLVFERELDAQEICRLAGTC